MKKAVLCIAVVFNLQFSLSAFAAVDLASLLNDYNSLKHMAGDVRSSSVQELSYDRQWKDAELVVNKVYPDLVQWAVSQPSSQKMIFGTWQTNSWFNIYGDVGARFSVKGDQLTNKYSAVFARDVNSAPVNFSYSRTVSSVNASIVSPERNFSVSMSDTLSRASIIEVNDPAKKVNVTYDDRTRRFDLNASAGGSLVVSGNGINNEYSASLTGKAGSLPSVLTYVKTLSGTTASFVSPKMTMTFSYADTLTRFGVADNKESSNNFSFINDRSSRRVTVKGGSFTADSAATSTGRTSALTVTGSGTDRVDVNLVQVKATDQQVLTMNGVSNGQKYTGTVSLTPDRQTLSYQSDSRLIKYAHSDVNGVTSLRFMAGGASLSRVTYFSYPLFVFAVVTYRNSQIAYIGLHHSGNGLKNALIYQDTESGDQFFYYRNGENGGQSVLSGTISGFTVNGMSTKDGAASIVAVNSFEHKNISVNVIDHQAVIDYTAPNRVLAATLGRGIVNINYSDTVKGRNDSLILTKDTNGNINLAAALDNWKAAGQVTDQLTALNLKDDKGNALDIAFNKELGTRLINGIWNGEQIKYEGIKTASGWDSSLVITSSDGDIRSISADRFHAIEHGRVDELVTALHDDLKVNLDFEKHFGSDGQDFVKFNYDTRLLSAEISGYKAEWRVAKDGYLQYSSPDGQLAFRANNPVDGRMDLPMFRYEDSFMKVKLDNTFLAYSKELSVLGLYDSRSYLIKMYLVDSKQLENEAKDIYDQVRQGDYHQKSAGEYIKDNVKEVKVNAREIVRSGDLVFKDRQWNSMFSSLAWDVGEFSLSGEDLGKVADAKDHKEQLYILLDRIAPQGIRAEVLNKERSLFYQLGSSLSSGNAANTTLGVTSLSQPTQVNFSSTTAAPLANTEGVSSGFSSGMVDASIPLVGSSSYTHLSLRGEAQRAFIATDNEVLNTGSANVHVTNLLYAYRFAPDTQLNIEQGYRRQFAVDHQTRSLYSYDLRDASGNNQDGLQDLGYVVPGMMQGVSIKDNDQRWHTDVTLMPYVPVTVNDQMKFGIGNGAGASSSALTSELGYAVDMRGGVAMDVFKQKLDLEAGKDVNDMLTLGPELTLAEKYKIGTSVTGATLGNPETYRYHLGAEALGLNSQVFVEENVVSKTNSLGMSFDKKLGEDIYNFSTGVSYWDNAGVREAVESYYSVGVNLHERVQLVNTLLVDQLTGSLGFQTSSLLNLDKHGYTSLGLDAGMTDLYGADVMLKAKTVF